MKEPTIGMIGGGGRRNLPYSVLSIINLNDPRLPPALTLVSRSFLPSDSLPPVICIKRPEARGVTIEFLAKFR